MVLVSACWVLFVKGGLWSHTRLGPGDTEEGLHLDETGTGTGTVESEARAEAAKTGGTEAAVGTTTTAGQSVPRQLEDQI